MNVLERIPQTFFTFLIKYKLERFKGQWSDFYRQTLIKQGQKVVHKNVSQDCNLIKRL